MPSKLSTRNFFRLNQPIYADELRSVSRDRSSSPSSSPSPTLPSFHERKRQRRSWRAFARRKFDYKHGSDLSRRAAYRNRALMVLFMVLVLTGIAIGTWYSLVLALIKRLSPKAPPSNGLETITKNWHNPSDSTSLLSPWPKDFSRDIIPKSCHSHNDYARNIPLYDALAVGCSSVEADIWLRHDVDGNEVLLVGHTSRSLTSDRSLSALYLDPLLQILNNQNNPDPYPTEAQHQTLQPAGIFSSYPNTTTVLLLDFKEDSATLFPAVVNALEPFRQKGYLTTYANDTLTTGPLTIVASGLASLSDVTSPNTTLSRSIFLDAPLDSLSSSLYNTTNSYYASLSLSKAVGYLWAGKFSSKQVETVKEQISAAEEKGLKSRYWGTISWPIPWRMGTWKTLMENGVSVLNVDDLESAGRWDWAVCVVASFALCGW